MVVAVLKDLFVDRFTSESWALSWWAWRISVLSVSCGRSVGRQGTPSTVVFGLDNIVTWTCRNHDCVFET